MKFCCFILFFADDSHEIDLSFSFFEKKSKLSSAKNLGLKHSRSVNRSHNVYTSDFLDEKKIILFCILKKHF